MNTIRQVRVWDRFVRLFHWSLVASFFTACGTSGAFGSPHLGNVHEISGYVALGLVIARILWGFWGKEHARFENFVPSNRQLGNYVLALIRRREPRYIGHNPAAAVMILFLLGMVGGIGVSGWAMTLDAFWGDEQVEEIHAMLADIIVVAVGIHMSAAVYTSLRHRENIIWSMITGTKRAATEDQDHAPGEEAAAPVDGNQGRPDRLGTVTARGES